MFDGRKPTNLVFDKPASKAFQSALVLAPESADEHHIVAGCLHVQWPIHVGGAWGALQMRPHSNFRLVLSRGRSMARGGIGHGEEAVWSEQRPTGRACGRSECCSSPGGGSEEAQKGEK